MDRSFRALAILAVVPGCFQPEDADVPELTLSDSGTGGTATEGNDGESTTSQTTVEPTDTATTEPEICGNGSVEGDEVCDDGENDGSYGSCVADCSAHAEFCGDGDINGPEVCDDRTNDGSYGGCMADCGSLGPFCGDGEMQAPELCDQGENNENGQGCNVDCVTSGTVVGTYELGGLDFCDGQFVTQVAFRPDGNALVGVTGYCNEDSVVLAELSPTVELVQMFDVLLPQTPVRWGVVIGDDWVLASSGCNYRISAAGALTEICEARTIGNMKLESADDGKYVALDYGTLALYPDGSPMLGDSPSWSALPPDDATFTHNYYDATFGANGSVVVTGSRAQVGGPNSVGFVAHYSAGGNLAGTYSFPSVAAYYAMARGPDNTMLLTSDYPEYIVTKLDASFAEAWSVPMSADSTIWPAIDSTGAVVLAYHDSSSAEGVVRKLTADGQAELWNLPLPTVDDSMRMSIDGSDAIWVSSTTSDGSGEVLEVRKISP